LRVKIDERAGRETKVSFEMREKDPVKWWGMFRSRVSI